MSARACSRSRRMTEPGTSALVLRHRKLHPSSLLQIPDHVEEVLGLRVATRPEHPDQAFGWRSGRGPEFFKTDGRLDVVAEDRLSGLHVTGEHRIDSLTQKCLRKFRVILDVALDQLLEALCSCHCSTPMTAHPLTALVVLPIGD